MSNTRGTKRRLHGLRVLLLLIVLALVYLGVLSVRIVRDGRRDECAAADVIIVLGAAQYNGSPSPIYQARLDHALALYRLGYAPYLLFTGGKKTGDRFTEADTGRNYAIDAGVPCSAIFVEDYGRTTWQSLQSSTDILRREGLPRALLVSDPYHALRLRRMAHDLNMRAIFSPANSPIQSLPKRVSYIGREMAAYTVYRLLGM